MKVLPDAQPNLFEALIKSAQYLLRLHRQQDIWDHVGQFVTKYLAADWTAFIRRDNANQVVIHRCSLPEELAQKILTEEVRRIVLEVLDSGFLASHIIHAPFASMTAFLPVVADSKTEMVMLVGHSSSDALSKESLNVYLAIAGLAGSTSERLNTEMELYRHRAHLEDLVRERTAELDLTKRRNELILHSAGEGICGLDLDGNLTFINPAAARLTGWEPDELIGRNAHAVFHHSRFPGVPYPEAECPILSTLGKKDRACITSEQFVRRDGTIFPAEFMTTSIVEAGRPVGAVLVFRDITKRKQAEAALRESEQRWAVTLASIGDAVIATDVNGRVTFLNNVAEELTGWTMAEAEHRPVQEVFHIINEYTRAIVDDPVSKVLQNGMIVGLANHTMLIRKDGKEVPIDDSGAPIRDAGGRILGAVLIFRDITERKCAEDALQAGKKRLELLAVVAERLLRSENPQAIVEELCRLVMAHLDCQVFVNYLVGTPGKRLHLNASAGISSEMAEEIRQLDFGIAVCGCVARDKERLITGNIQLSDDPRTQLVRSFGIQAYCCHPLLAQDQLIGTLSFGTKTRPAFTSEDVALMKSVADQVSVAMQRLQSEKALHLMNESLAQQVAERTAVATAKAKQLQALAVELIEAEERERRQFALLLHDDLQQLLAAAKLQLQMAAKKLPYEPILQNVNQILEESIAKARRLSHDLSPAVLPHSSLFEVLQWLSRQMNDQFGLQVEVRKDVESRSESEPLKRFLFRAVQELLFNIVKHAGVTHACVVLSGTNSNVTVTVSDRGRGFDPGAIDSSVGKAGFGLLSIRERASYIGGQLTIDSTPGEGSCFTLTVPLSLDKADDHQQVEPGHERPSFTSRAYKKKPGTSDIRALFVDDHQVMRQGLIRLMANQPEIHVAGEAANGREALELARRIRPDVIVMDISMPEMDGIEATRHIKHEMPEVRVIGLSMHDDEHLAEAMLKAGAEAFVNKAASPAELLRAIYGIHQEDPKSDEINKVLNNI